MSWKIIERDLWNSIKRFLSPMKELKLEYSKEVFKALLSALNGVIHVFFLERVVSILELGESERFYSLLQVYLFYILAFEILYFSIRKWGWMNTLPFTVTNIYKEYLDGYIQMNNNKIELIGTGKLVWILTGWSRTWARLLTDGIEQASNIFVWIIFTLYMVWRVDIYYSIAFIVFLLFFFFTIRWINKKLQVFRSLRYEYRNIRLRHVVKIIMSKMEILQAGRMSWEIDILWDNSWNISEVSRNMATYRWFMKRFAPFVLTLLIFAVFFFLWWAVLWGDVNLSIVVWLTGTLIIMQNTISNALSFYVAFTKDFIDVEKLWDFFDTTPQIEGYEEWNTFKHESGKIELKNLSYGYTPETPIFKDFSLKIPGNSVTALVGPSGGGKSTLVKLISGYIRQDSWDIFIDDQNLRETSLKSYYKDIGYLTQEPSVFDGTVRENLKYGIWEPSSLEKRRDVSEGVSFRAEMSLWLSEAITLAHCEFIYDLPNGLDTEIGERGVKLSWGQKQRLAIAKIFLKDPKIIILDEPTSALDSVSEKKITEAMHNLFTWRTVIVIAHRLQTVKHADDIIVIGWWKVIERGTHSELTKKKGFYKEMLDLQSGF